MPLRLSAGVTKKIGLPGYSSIGANCQIEVDLDGALTHFDLEVFQQRVRDVYTACGKAVRDELARQQRRTENGVPARLANESASETAIRLNGHPQQATNAPRATARQVDYARQLAAQIHGFGDAGLDALACELHGKPVSDLSSVEASTLIDALKNRRRAKSNDEDEQAQADLTIGDPTDDQLPDDDLRNDE